MLYPMLPVEKKTKDFIDLFGGYNHNIRIQENEFYDMENLSSDNYPVLTTRSRRGNLNIKLSEEYKGFTKGLLYKNCLYSISIINGVVMIFKNGELFTTLTTQLSDDIKRTMVMVGAYVVVLPDKIYFNTTNIHDQGNIESIFSSNESDIVTVVPCNIDGSTYNINGVSATIPENVWDGFVWLDTNDSPATLKRFTTTNSTWNSIPTTYIRVTCKGIGKCFSSGDGVKISGLTNSDNEKLNGSTIIQNIIDEDNIVITGILDTIQSRNVMSVRLNTDSKTATTDLNVYCDASVGAIEKDTFKNKKVNVNGKIYECIGNTEPVFSTEYEIDTSESDKWLGFDSATLEVSRDCVDSNKLYISVSNETGLNSSILVSGLPIMVGNDKQILHVIGVGTDEKTTGTHAVIDYYLQLQEITSIQKGAILSPVKEYLSDSLKCTTLTLNTSGQKFSAQKGDGVSLALESVWSQIEPITISRTMPVLDYIIESNNRLWGCRYGDDGNGNFVNQIYASALGDFKNWSIFEGTSADSYFATVGTSGEFTGAINYMGYPVFFKEDYIHTVFGAYPSQYQINTTVARGVQKGSDKSLSIINEVLYYKANDGIMAYTGSLPNCISQKLGKKQYYKAIACGYKNKLYIVMSEEKENQTGTNHLFIYDINYGTWYKENGIDAEQLFATQDDVIYLSETSLKSLFATGGYDEEYVEWYAETGLLGINTINKKYVTRMNIRMHLDFGSSVSFFIKYDSDRRWKLIKTINGTCNIESVFLPILPRRTDNFRIRLEGKGDMKIYSISKTIEEGSDL